MAEFSTIARPYAEGVFSLADTSGRLAQWSEALANIEQVAADERVAQALADPSLSASQAAGVLIGILAGKLSGEEENFIRVLAENKRLDLIGEIRLQFEALRNAREGIVQAGITTAFALDDAQLAALVQTLEARFGKRVQAHVIVDPELIAGVRIAIGDKVIDGSARAQLAALEAALQR